MWPDGDFDDDDDEPFELGGEATVVVDSSLLHKAEPGGARDRHLLVRSDRSALGRVMALTEREYLVGRNADCDIWLDHDGVSRRHAHFVWRDGTYVLEDLGSSNGTFVQGRRVERRPLHDGDLVQIGPIVLFRYTVTDAEHEETLRELYEASVRDALTGAYNRDHLDERLKGELAFAARHHTEVSFLMLDLDHFKQVNDTYGHQAGDAVLVAVAAAIQQNLRTEDIFARYGGEEFAVVYRGTALAAAEQAAERLRQMVESLPVEFEGRRIPIRISVGCSSVACCSVATPVELIGVADRRLYAAKHAGRNRVVASG